MKILNVEQIREADAYTIEHEPIASIELMERASRAFVEAFVDLPLFKTHIKIVCGCGNNAGDGMAIARLLHQRNFEVEVWALQWGSQGSEDFNINKERWSAMGTIIPISKIDELPPISEHHVLIDAIFGSGIKGEVRGLPAEVIAAMNRSTAEVVAIDMPSGLLADQPLPSENGVVRAAYTLTFQNPKLAFLLPQSHQYVGQWQVLDIGLAPEFIEEAATPYQTLDASFFQQYAQPSAKFAHKGTYGHALLVSGSKGKIGATVLAAHAALRSGLGLLTVHLPACGYQILQTALPEAMIQLDDHEEVCSSINWSESFTCAGLGPGLGTHTATVKALKDFFQQVNTPVVVDADALNIISENRELLEILAPGSILTPHPKEFERLAGNWDHDFERLQLQRQMSADYNLLVVCKGAHTTITLPDGRVYFNTTGNSGMATAGSGDVLTGVITGLLARTNNPEQAALLGVYIHGLAGDLAAETWGEISMIAGDITEKIGAGFKKLGLPL